MKGTASHGKHSRSKSHIRCRRCGQQTYHASHKECSSCGFGKTAKLRSYSWNKKSRAKAISQARPYKL